MRAIGFEEPVSRASVTIEVNWAASLAQRRLYDFARFRDTLPFCLTVSFTCVLEQLSIRSLESRPITVCVIGLVFAVRETRDELVGLPDVEVDGLSPAEAAAWTALVLSGLKQDLETTGTDFDESIRFLTTWAQTRSDIVRAQVAADRAKRGVK